MIHFSGRPSSPAASQFATAAQARICNAWRDGSNGNRFKPILTTTFIGHNHKQSPHFANRAS
jgi:hypothetical protein